MQEFADLLVRIVKSFILNICSSASNRIISAKDHASIQINIAEVGWLVFPCIKLFRSIYSCLFNKHGVIRKVCTLEEWMVQKVYASARGGPADVKKYTCGEREVG